MIGRARKRPRKRSVAWRSVGWVIRRQAALVILTPDVTLSGYRRLVLWVAGVDGRILARQVARVLQRDPTRRNTP